MAIDFETPEGIRALITWFHDDEPALHEAVSEFAEDNADDPPALRRHIRSIAQAASNDGEYDLMNWGLRALLFADDPSDDDTAFAYRYLHRLDETRHRDLVIAIDSRRNEDPGANRRA